MENILDTPPPSPRSTQAHEALAYALWVLDQASFHEDTFGMDWEAGEAEMVDLYTGGVAPVA